MEASRQLPPSLRRFATLGVVAVGVALSILAHRDTRAREQERTETAFARQAAIRHSVTVEQLSRYQDLLYTLRTMFSMESKVARNTFVRATRWLEASYEGVQALEWVPLVEQEERAEMEEATGKSYGQPFEFKELGADGQLVRAADHPFYYPVVYVHPVPGNERAWGYDLRSGPTRDDLERARKEGQMVVTGQVKLVQGKDETFGFVMIWPVLRRPEASVDPKAFLGFVQAVMRTHAVFETILSRQSERDLDMMFVDTSASDPARRLLYFRPADAGHAPASAATRPPGEDEFRTGLNREFPLSIGGRDWRVLYRPTPAWLGEQVMISPWLRTSGILFITGLLAGLVHTLGRRTEVIAQTVAERTAQLTESRRELDSFVESLPGMAYRGTYGAKFLVTYVSAGCIELTGYTPEDFVSGRIHLRDLVHPDDLERVRESTRTCIAAGRPVELEYRARVRDGTVKWLLARGHTRLKHGDGTCLFEGLVIDITARKQAEHERIALERKLLEGQKLESLGVLAGGIAHDFNNLLTGILGNANLSRLLLPNSTVDPQLRAIETASLRAAELCRQMLAYAGKGRFVVEPVDLGALATGLVPLLEVSIARKALLRFNLAPVLPAVLADATQLRQIVMNLVLNAADATGGRQGEIVLTTGLLRADRAMLTACVAGSELAAGDYVFLEVRDNGCGMSPEVLAKIFDPFYTTKFAGRGLGLAAVLGIVRSHHGALQVASEPGRGSTFRLILPPVADGSVAAMAGVLPALAHSWQHPGRALVIEDEEPVRLVTARMLETFGLTPAVAADGHAGVEALRENPAACEFVVLDVLMPGLSGEETLVALRRLRPDLRVLLMSGYNEGDLLRRLADPRSPLAFLQKPFTREALEEKLRGLLR